MPENYFPRLLAMFADTSMSWPCGGLCCDELYLTTCFTIVTIPTAARNMMLLIFSPFLSLKLFGLLLR